MTLQKFPVKGIPQHWLDDDLNGEPLHLHISEVGPGERAHPPHQHGGLEAFYMLSGSGTLELGDEHLVLKANESAVFDPQKLHGLFNHGQEPMRYMVVLVAETEA